jgi:hypothetical protein
MVRGRIIHHSMCLESFPPLTTLRNGSSASAFEAQVGRAAERIDAMSKRNPNRVVPASRLPESVTPLRNAFMKRTKAELVEVLLELANADRGVLRRLTAQFDVSVAPDKLVAVTRQAIIDATAFNVREINRNFAYDYAAYNEVKRNLSRLIRAGQLRVAMDLSLELMKRGSHQVEMSDEGLMTQDIEDCLSVVFSSLRKRKLSALELDAWCSAMLRSDRVQFIAKEQLQSLRGYFQASTG